MPDRSVRELFERWVDAVGSLDFDALADLVTADFVEDFPQSGERLRGIGALRRMLEQYPGGVTRLERDDFDLRMLHEERWAITPGYTVVPLAGHETYTAIFRNRYPDDSVWQIISFFRVRDGRFSRRTTYFAPEFDPPQWRDGITERIPRRPAGVDE